MKIPGFMSGLNETRTAENLLLLCGLSLFAAICIWCVYFLPMNMDEALVYHRLACSSHPFSFLHSFREDCINIHEQTTIFGFTLPRAYGYVGPFHGFLYAPVYYLFHSMEAQYWFAMPFLFLFAWLMARETGNPRRVWPIFLACLPLILKFVHDDGVFKIMAVTFPVAALLTRRMLSSEGALHYFYAALLPIIVTFNVIDKVYFLYLLPSFIFFCLAFTGDKNWKSLSDRLWKASPTLISIGVATGLLLLVHMFSKSREGEYYILWLMDVSEEKQPYLSLLLMFVSFIFYWPSYAHRALDTGMGVAPTLFFVIPAAAWFAFCIGTSIKTMNKGEGVPLRISMLLLSIISMVVVFLIFRNVWAAHHFIYLWIPGLMLLAELVSKLRYQSLLAVVGGFFALNAVALAYMMEAPLRATESWERYAIFDYLQKEVPASKTIVNFSSWGGYYIYSLYAPKNQVVTYTDPLDRKSAMALMQVSRSTDRKIYNVCSGPLCNVLFLEQAFDKQLNFSNALPGLPVWRLFEAEPVRAASEGK